ncbi:hypothetical protein O988_01625 [Pseudogymnoascus sp. VKM F-3808]|nr:hypothetical protein O988_01625 [Pseudogymnoascus sp. VKM F-3808]
MVSSNSIHENRALTFASLRDQIVSLGKRAGYRDNVKIHAIHARVANKIKDPQIRKQVMGQKSNAIYEEYYRSGLVKENIFALFSNKVGSTKHIKFKERQKLYTEKSNLLRLARASHREKWFSGSFNEEAQQQLQQEGEDDETLPKPASKFPLIRHLMLERNCIANALLVTKDLQSKEG